MWLLSKNLHQFQFLLLYLFLLLLLSVHNEVYSQSVITSNQVAKEGDNEVVITCNYSQVTTTPQSVLWSEVDEAGAIIMHSIVNNLKVLNGRYSFRITPGKAELVIAELVITKPLRNDTNRRFECQVQTHTGEFIYSDSPSILTVYYLYEPVITASANSVYEGESVNLNCSKPNGNPVPSITWYKDRQALSTTDTTRFLTSEDALEIHIESATAADGGLYMCKAESDQFKGEEGKTSNQIDLKIKYLTVTFESQAGTATCTANYPKPSSVMIYKNGELIENGTLTASVKINEEICKLNITCYAEIGDISATEPLKTCNTEDSSKFDVKVNDSTANDSIHKIDGSNSTLYALCVIPVIGLIWIQCLIYFIFCRNIEVKGDDLAAVEGDKSLAMKIKYRPSIACYSNIQWHKKNEEKDKVEWKKLVIASAPKLGLKYILHCCFYFCGICCYEYIEKYQNDEKKGKTSKGYEKIHMKVVSKRGSADGQDKCDDVNAPGKVVPGEGEAYVNMGKENIIEESKPTSTTDEESESLKGSSGKNQHQGKLSSEKIQYADLDLGQSTSSKITQSEEQTHYLEMNQGKLVYIGKNPDKTKRDNHIDKPSEQYSVDANGRGTINLKISDPVRSNGGDYKCTMVRRGKAYSHINNLCVYWIDLIQVDEEAEEGDTFEMKVIYGPIDKGVLGCIWKKHEDGRLTNVSNDKRFETTTDYEKGSCSLKISKVTLADAGKYQCTVELHGGKQLVASRMLLVNKAPITLKIADATTNDGTNIIRMFLKITTESIKAEQIKIANIIWYKGEFKLTSLIESNRKERYQTAFEGDNVYYLCIKDVTTADAGEYCCCCEVEVKGRKFTYKCAGHLKVEGPVLSIVDENIDAIQGEDVDLCFNLLNPVLAFDSFTFYKMSSGTLKKVAGSNDVLEWRYKTKYVKEKQQFILTILAVESSQAGAYMCRCFTKNHVGKEHVGYSSTTICLNINQNETIEMSDEFSFDGEESTTFTCAYHLKNMVNTIRWIKKATNEMIIEFDLGENLSSTLETEKYKADFGQDFSQLRIKRVIMDDAGVYTCELISRKPLPYRDMKRRASATLSMPCNVFGSATPSGAATVYRNPAVVIVNLKVIIFCEEQLKKNYTRVLLRTGKLKEPNQVDLETQQIILDKNGTRFQNLVPLIVDEKNGHVILMCLEHTAKQDGCKVVKLKSINNGRTWSKPEDVTLKWSEEMQSSAKIVCIGPGHGLCLQSGKLVTAGVIKFNKQTRLCLITSADKGNTWEVVPVPSSYSPKNASFGKHTQIVEYAKDKVCITCSLEDCHQRFNVFSNDGCKTFHEAKLEPKLIEANPGCQAGIICIPSLLTEEKVNFIAFTNPVNELQFENLSVRVSRDGCKTWSPPLLTLRKAFAKSSDLAYYKFEGGLFHVDRGGLACVYENTTGNNILMQLISQDQIKKSFKICESK